MEHWCVGCADTHLIPVPRWTFNGDMVKPSFHPSVRITWGRGELAPEICHYFIKDGQIEFCPDSTHAWAGRTVDLLPIPADE